jgi:hypothetical protein
MASTTRMALIVASLLLISHGVAADGGDVVTNNLFSDLAPYVDSSSKDQSAC